MNDHALEALLAEYVAPPVPAGLAGRAAAAALALPQEPRPAYARRSPRDRRGSWLRRPMIIGGIALGLAVSGAVAATLAGVRLDRLPIVQAVLAELPFAGRGTPPEAAPPPHAAPPAQAPLPVEPALVQESPIAIPRVAEPPAHRPVPARDGPVPVAAPVSAPQRSEVAGPRLIETRPPPVLALPLPAPSPMAREERTVLTRTLEPRAPAPSADEEARLQQERIERAERLRVARQAQIERLQRIQQRRERIGRLRRD